MHHCWPIRIGIKLEFTIWGSGTIPTYVIREGESRSDQWSVAETTEPRGDDQNIEMIYFPEDTSWAAGMSTADTSIDTKAI